MRALLSIGWILLVVAVAPMNSMSLARQDNNSAEALTVSTEILHQEYCANADGKTYRLGGRARIRFTNSGKKNLLLGDSLGIASYQFHIARDAEALSRREYDYKPNFDWSVIVESAPDAQSAIFDNNGAKSRSTEHDSWEPGAGFWILKPGNHFERELPFSVEEIRLDDSGRLRSGKHVLEFQFETDEQPGLDYKALRKLWALHGDLVTGLVLSSPTPLSIPSNPALEKCRY